MKLHFFNDASKQTTYSLVIESLKDLVLRSNGVSKRPKRFQEFRRRFRRQYSRSKIVNGSFRTRSKEDKHSYRSPIVPHHPQNNEHLTPLRNPFLEIYPSNCISRFLPARSEDNHRSEPSLVFQMHRIESHKCGIRSFCLHSLKWRIKKSFCGLLTSKAFVSAIVIGTRSPWLMTQIGVWTYF